MLRRLVEASLLALPVYAALALYALGLRVVQYGWTVDRFWALLIALAVAGYALGYALAVLRRRGRWLQALEPVNRWMCWVVLALALLGNSPLLDPVRLTLSSQLERLRADPPAITSSDVNVLRFDLGRRGVQALRELQRDPAIIADANAPQVVAAALARTSRWDDGHRLDKGPQDVAALRRALKLAAGSSSPPDDWWKALATRSINGESCAQSERDCLIVHRDRTVMVPAKCCCASCTPTVDRTACCTHVAAIPSGAGPVRCSAPSAGRPRRSTRPCVTANSRSCHRAGRCCPSAGTLQWPSIPNPNPNPNPTSLPHERLLPDCPGHPVHDYYHANEYGFPQRDERELFERLVLEINQAGLSWETILKKREGFRAAYDGFDVDRVAAYAEQDIARLLSDPGIIRNRLKVLAAIHNAQVIQQLRASHGSFAAWLDAHHPRSKADWVKLFKKTFRFTGGEITGEFLMSRATCPVRTPRIARCMRGC